MPDVARLARGAAGAIAVLAAFVAVALASRAPIGKPATGSELRLALRTAHARIEVCRERSDEELERLPAHFRVRRECEETAIDYRLTLDVDGARRIDRVVSHRGVRRTRPLAVDVAIPLSAGSRQVEISFVPELPALLSRVQRGEGDSQSLGAQFATLPAPRFSARLEFVTGRAELVVLDESGRFRRSAAPGP